MHRDFTDTAVNHFISNHGSYKTGINLQPQHHEQIAQKFLPHAAKLVDHLQNAVGGSAGSGGSIHTGGGFGDLSNVESPEENVQMYHKLLNMNPHEFEAYREGATQMLGGVPSRMWGSIENPNEALETEADDYENIINMPNVHAAARMLEADDASPTGGGFGKALRHVGRKLSSIYKVGRAGINFLDRNRGLLDVIPGVKDYSSNINSFIDSAKAIDDSINPLVEAAIDAGRSSATDEDRQKLKQLATQSIDAAVKKHIPQAQPFLDAAKDLSRTIKNPNYNPNNDYQPLS